MTAVRVVVGLAVLAVAALAGFVVLLMHVADVMDRAEQEFGSW